MWNFHSKFCEKRKILARIMLAAKKEEKTETGRCYKRVLNLWYILACSVHSQCNRGITNLWGFLTISSELSISSKLVTPRVHSAFTQDIVDDFPQRAEFFNLFSTSENVTSNMLAYWKCHPIVSYTSYTASEWPVRSLH